MKQNSAQRDVQNMFYISLRQIYFMASQKCCIEMIVLTLAMLNKLNVTPTSNFQSVRVIDPGY